MKVMFATAGLETEMFELSHTPYCLTTQFPVKQETHSFTAQLHSAPQQLITLSRPNPPRSRGE